MSSSIDKVGDRSGDGKLGAAKGTVNEIAGTLVGDETREAQGAIQKHLSNPETKDSDPERHPIYKVVAIYPTFAEVTDTLYRLKGEGFADDQINLLGREQEHWQEKLGREWEAHKSAKGALVGGALGAVPGLVLVAGIALTGGVGLLAVGPMIGAMSALGMGSLVGGVLGAGSNAVDVPLNVEEEVADAIGLGQWVIIVQCHTDAEAALAQRLLPATRIVWENKIKARETGAAASPAAEQTDLIKLAAVVDEAFAPVKKLSGRPVEQVMCDVENADSPELKAAVQEAVKKISTATGLAADQVTAVFKEHRSTDVNIVGVLRERSKAAVNA